DAPARSRSGRPSRPDQDRWQPTAPISSGGDSPLPWRPNAPDRAESSGPQRRLQRPRAARRLVPRSTPAEEASDADPRDQRALPDVQLLLWAAGSRERVAPAPSLAPPAALSVRAPPHRHWTAHRRSGP